MTFAIARAFARRVGSSVPAAVARGGMCALVVVLAGLSGVSTAGAADGDTIDEADVHVGATSSTAFEVAGPVVDRLARRTVLSIDATGFETSGTGFVAQCTVGGCANLFPVVFDANGAAHFQYLVTDAFARSLSPASTCRAGEPPCAVQLRANGHSAFVTTIFRDAAPAPRRVTVERRGGERAAEARFLVTASGFNPGERVQATVCAAPDTYGPARCGPPGPVSAFTIDRRGAGHTTLVIRAGRVGAARAKCGRETTCGVIVTPPGSAVPAPVAPVAFSAGPSARYAAARGLTGSAIALALLALATVLVRSTDWRKPTEADTPELDRAVIT